MSLSSNTNTKGHPELAVVKRWVGNSRLWLDRFLDSTPTLTEVVSVVAMGSAVRERGHRRSDLDVLILYRGKRPRISAPMEVDIRWYAAEESEEKLANGHEVIGWAMKFGEVIYDRNGFWQQLQLKWKDRVPLPSADEARQRGEKSLAEAQVMMEADDESAADDLILAAITQFVREKLILNDVFPASRPELPAQLRSISPGADLADLLDDSMFGDRDVEELIQATANAVGL